MDSRGIVCVGMNSTNLAQVRDKLRAFMNTAMNLQVPENVGKFFTN
jgi:hypothetical protein